MNTAAIEHKALSDDVCLLDEQTLLIRIHAARKDLQQCLLYYGDRVSVEDPVPMRELEMERIASDEDKDYFEVRVRTGYTRVCYYFRLVDREGRALYLSEYGFIDRAPRARSQFFQFPYLRREYLSTVPDWARDMVMYHIFPDSFASGHRTISGKGKFIRLENGEHSESLHGGTLQGIEANLDYLENLGITCIYLNPIFEAASYHKYDTIDYFKIDPCFGSKDDLIHLVSACHERGIKVILDGVFNHCGAGFEAFRDVRQKGEQSAYKDWFYQMNYPVCYQDPPDYACFAYVKEMPKLNTSNKDVSDYFCRVGQYWIREADIDGWRLDVANEIDHDFWRQFRKAVKAVKADVFLIGEVWEDSNVWLAGDQFDSTMNYRFADICRAYFARKEISLTEFDQKMNRMYMRYRYTTASVQMNFLDTHDISRFLSACDGDVERLKKALYFMFMTEGIPSVFYGDECQLTGVEEKDYRQPMKWSEQLSDLQECCRKWIGKRNQSSALRRGRFRTVSVDEENKIYTFRREYEGECETITMDMNF